MKGQKKQKGLSMRKQDDARATITQPGFIWKPSFPKAIALGFVTVACVIWQVTDGAVRGGVVVALVQRMPGPDNDLDSIVDSAASWLGGMKRKSKLGEMKMQPRGSMRRGKRSDRQKVQQMSLTQLRDEHQVLEKQLREVRARLQNKRLLQEVLALQQTIGVMRQRAALEGAVLRTRHGTKFQLLSGQTTPSMLTAPVGQTFLDNDNPLYNANPADKGMDPDKRPYLKGPFHGVGGDLAHPETVMISFVVALNRGMKVELLSCQQQPFVGSGTQGF